MIAVVQRGPTLCVVQSIGREGLKVKVLTYCNNSVDASYGVAQVPDKMLKQACGACKLGIAQLEARLPA